MKLIKWQVALPGVRLRRSRPEDRTYGLELTIGRWCYALIWRWVEWCVSEGGSSPRNPHGVDDEPCPTCDAYVTGCDWCCGPQR